LVGLIVTEGGIPPSAFPGQLRQGKKSGKSPEYPISNTNRQVLRHSWQEL
jgi:hypothetical protein